MRRLRRFVTHPNYLCSIVIKRNCIFNYYKFSSSVFSLQSIWRTYRPLCSVHCGRPIPNRSLAKLLRTVYCVRCWKQRSFATSKKQRILGKLVKYLACGSCTQEGIPTFNRKRRDFNPTLSLFAIAFTTAYVFKIVIYQSIVVHLTCCFSYVYKI